MENWYFVQKRTRFNLSECFYLMKQSVWTESRQKIENRRVGTEQKSKMGELEDENSFLVYTGNK